MINSYLKLAFEELQIEDGLCIMSKGIGIEQLFLKFILSFTSTTEKNNKDNNNKVIFCLNTIEEEKWIKDCLYSEGIQQINFPKVKITLLSLLSLHSFFSFTYFKNRLLLVR